MMDKNRLRIILGITFGIGIIAMITNNDDNLLKLIRQSITDDNVSFSHINQTKRLKIKNEDISNSKLLDIIIEQIDFENVEGQDLEWRNISINGGSIKNSRLAGTHFDNVTFNNVELLNFNIAESTIKKVTFNNCKITDARGPHIFYKSFNDLSGDEITFNNTTIDGIMLSDSKVNLTIKNSKLDFANVNIEGGAKVTIINTEGKNVTGDHSILSSLTIENSTFYDSKFNDIRADEVSIIKLKGGLPVSGELGNVTVRHLETDNGRALFLGTGTINNLSVSACNKDTELKRVFIILCHAERNYKSI